MSYRKFFNKLLNQSKQLFQNVLKTQKNNNNNVKDVIVKRKTDLDHSRHESQTRAPRWQTLIQSYRANLFTLSRVPKSASRTPVFLGFSGFVLAAGFNNEHQEYMDITKLIKESFSEEDYIYPEKRNIFQSVLSCNSLEFGELIGQGCNAAVYEARQLQENQKSTHSSDLEKPDSESDFSLLNTDEEYLNEDAEEKCHQAPTEWPALHVEIGLTHEDLAMDWENFSDVSSEDISSEASFCVIEESTEDFDMRSEMSFENKEEILNEIMLSECSLPVKEYTLAVKMMFNYCVESCADRIMREMEREIVPARQVEIREQMGAWENGHRAKMKRLPPHPNIVDIQAVFVDATLCLPGALEHYPAALPQRLFDNGMGRNKTMYVVMKKYDMTLRDYLQAYTPSYTTRLMLLAQLLEAVIHLGQHGVVHRDMKSDNILLDTSTQSGVPSLVLGDFGCCLVDTEYNLRLPYPVDTIDKGGNTALMPPEIKNAVPGRFSVLDYSRADLWAVGALAYEILGADNPFYSSHRSNRNKLSSESYQLTELPPLPGNFPPQLEAVVKDILHWDPAKRPTAEVAANVIHILLWWPLHFLWHPESNKAHMSWPIVFLALELKAKVRGATKAEDGPKSSLDVPSQLKQSFLKRVNINDVSAALEYFM